MPYTDWRLKGPEIATCNCHWGCPCQFNSRPSHENCRAAVAMAIEEGHYGNVRLNGLRWANLLAWPGAIHEGHGEAQPIIDERADGHQREALLAILSGQESEPGATFFNVFAGTVDTVHQPLFRPIEFEADVDARTGRFVVPGIVEATAEPIRNPITGASHRVRVQLPHGFEFTEAEFASGAATASGAIEHHWANCHAHLAVLHLTPQGPVR